MNVSLTPELERFIAEQVESGRYRSASEVVRDGLRRLTEDIAEREARLDALRTAVEVGLAELDAGEAVPGDDVFRVLLDGLNESEAA
jgi:antitoxin ParD1/3/4